MTNLNEIRRHIRAVSKTRQITNAMYLLSTARMKRAMQHVDYNREYYKRVRATVKDILSKSSSVHHPYLDARPTKRAAYLVIASDKGMCGNYNSNILNFAWEQMRHKEQHYLGTIGIMATEFFRKKGMEPDVQWLGVAQNPTLMDARNITEALFREYDEGLMDEVYLISTRFVNSTVQYPRCVRLLPLNIDDYYDVELEFPYESDVIFEPSAQEVFHTLVPQYAVGLVFGSLVQAVASEHCARMQAMQNATRNADEMIKKLQAQYNAARQFAITQEILEITNAAQQQQKGN